MSKELSISKVERNFYKGQDAYIGAAYPCDEHIVAPCKTHTECCEGGYVTPPTEPKPIELPECFTIAWISTGEGQGEELNLNETDYTGDESTAFLDLAGFWNINIDGETYTKTDDSDSPYGTYCTLSGQTLTTVPCDKYVPEPVEEVECVRMVFNNLGLPEQDFQIDAVGAAYIGEFGGGVLTYLDGSWEWNIQGNVITGGDNPADPTGVYDGGDVCALFKPCSDKDPVALPDCLELVFRDNAVIVLGQWNLSGSDYNSVETTLGTITYNTTDGWVQSGTEGDYTKQDDPLNGDDPTGVYVAGNGDELLIRECE